MKCPVQPDIGDADRPPASRARRRSTMDGGKPRRQWSRCRLPRPAAAQPEPRARGRRRYLGAPSSALPEMTHDDVPAHSVDQQVPATTRPAAAVSRGRRRHDPPPPARRAPRRCSVRLCDVRAPPTTVAPRLAPDVLRIYVHYQLTHRHWVSCACSLFLS